MDVYQCPYCELKFRTESELQQHISFDHPKAEGEAKYHQDSPRSTAHRHRHRGYRHEH